jgi:hypothetical protein
MCDGATCTANSDCATNTCYGGVCKMCDSSDVNLQCGDAACTADIDCASNTCLSGVCMTCGNGNGFCDGVACTADN